MTIHRSKTATIIQALNMLGGSIQSEDGVANCVLLEAAQRMEELDRALRMVGTPQCANLHHKKAHRHEPGEPCPVEDLIYDLLEISS